MAQNIVSAIGFRADTSDFTRGEKDLLNFTKAQKEVQREGEKTSQKVADLGRALRALAGAFVIREALQLTDAYKQLAAQINLVTDSAIEQRRAIEQLNRLAIQNGQDISSLANTYARLARSSEALGLTQTEILRTTEALSNAILASGATAQEASAGLIQLSQGLASGALRGDELRSVMEQLPRVATALSAGLGISLGQLRLLGEEGAITTAAVVAALESQFDALRSEADEIPDTFEKAMARVRNSLILTFGQSDVANEFSNTIIGGLNSIANAIPDLVSAFDDFRNGVGNDFGQVGKELFDLSLIVGGVAIAFGPVPAAVVGAAVALQKFSDEIAQALIGSDDFILALRTMGSLGADAFSSFVNGAYDAVLSLNELAGAVFRVGGDISEKFARAIFGNLLYNAAEEYVAFVADRFEFAGKSAGQKFGEQFSAALKEAERARIQRANEIQLGDFGNALDDVADLSGAIEDLIKTVDGANITDALVAQFSAAKKEIENAGEIKVGVDLGEKVADTKADAQELKGVFQELAVSIGESFAELDKADRLAVLDQIKQAIEATDSDELRGVLEGYVDQLNAIEDAAASGEKALIEMARKPGESFQQFAARLKALSGNIKEASREAVEAYKVAIDKIEGEILDRASIAEAAAAGGEEAVELAKQEAKIRVDAAELYRKALAAGANVTRETTEELVRQREQLDALANFEINFGQRSNAAELREIAEQLKAIDEGGRRELERVQRRQELEKQILELRRQATAAGVSESDQIVAELELELLDAQRKKLEDEVDRLPDKAKDFVAIIDQGLNRAIGSFVDDLLRGGADFEDLITAIFTDITRDILAGPNGILTGITNPNADAVNLEKFFGSKDVDGELEKRFTKIFEGFGDTLGKVSKDLSEAFKSIAAELGEAASGAAAGFAGFKLGSGAADIFNGSQGETGGKVGGAVGGGIGFAVGGPVGAFIGSSVGSFFGDIFGGLFGRKTASGQFSFDANSISGVKDSKKDVRNDRRDEILTTSAEAIKALADVLDADFIAQIALSVDAGKKRITTSLIDERTGRTISSLSTAADDVAGAIDQALKQALSSVLEGGDEQLRRIADALSAANVPAEKLVDSLSKIGSVLDLGKEPVSEFAEAIEAINDVFHDAARASGSFTQAIRELAAAQLDALQSVAGAFDREIGDQLRRITSPISADVFDLLKLQKERIDDAQAINAAIADAAEKAQAIPQQIQQSFAGFNFGIFGARGLADLFNPAQVQNQTAQQNAATQAQLAAEAQERLNQVLALNTAEFIKLIENIGTSPEALAEAQDAFVEFAEQIIAQTDDIDAINLALQNATEGFRTAFNDRVFDDISQLTNPVLFAFNELVAKQAELENFARIVGGDLFAVQRRNALERREFFKRLSEDERRELVGLGDVIQDTFGRIGIVLQETFDLLDAQIDRGKELAQVARETGQAFRDAARDLRGIRQDLLNEFFPGNPDELLRDLLVQFEDARQRALGGDVNAGDQVGEIGRSIIELQRSLSASDPAFFAQLRRITDQILEVETFFDDQADSQFALADAIESDNDLLKQMRDLLASDDPTIPVLTEIRDGLSAGNVEAQALFSELIDLLTIQNAQQAEADALFEAMSAQAIANAAIQNVTPFQPSLTAAAPAPIVNVSSPTAAFTQAIQAQTNALQTSLEAQADTLDELESDMSTMKKDITKLVAYLTQNSARVVLQ